MSKFFFCEDFFTFFFLKSAKGVSINYVDTFKPAPTPFLDLWPHAWNNLAYSGLCSTYENPCAIFSNYKDFLYFFFYFLQKNVQHEKWKKIYLDSRNSKQTPNIVLVFKVILKNLVEQKALISEDLEQWNQIYCCSYSHLN